MVEAKQDEKALAKQGQANSKEGVGIPIRNKHTAAECKEPRQPKGYGKGVPKGGKKGYGKGGKSDINNISED